MNTTFKTWHPVDNAGRLFSSTADKRLTTVFRLSVTLAKPVHVDQLQKALDTTIVRFPCFAVCLKAGAFWYYFEENPEKLKLLADSRTPCLDLDIHRRKAFLFRIRAYHKRIAVEFAHALTDGTGALEFLKTLTAEYLRRTENTPSPFDGIMHPDEAPHLEECEDAFQRYNTEKLPLPPKPAKAFHIPFKEAKSDHYIITTGVLSAQQVLAKAKEHGVSATDYLSAVYIRSFQRILKRLPKKMRKKCMAPIRLDLPMNLRTFFPTKSMRNFFLPLHPEIDPRLGWFTFDEILKQVHHKIRCEANPHRMKQLLHRNVSATRNPLNRFVPLIFKNALMSNIYNRYGLSTTTSGLSNLGKVVMPEHLRPFIERFDFIPTHPGKRGVNCGIITFADQFVITFARTRKQALVERVFFRFLAGDGLHVNIESNKE